MKIELLDENKLNEIAENIASGNTIVEAINKNNNTQVDIINKYSFFKYCENTFNGIEYIAKYLQDSTTTDIMINNDGSIWVENAKGMKNVKKEKLEPEQVKQLAIRLASMCEKRLDEACPIVDGSLPNGIRFNAILEPISAKGTCISFRTKTKNIYSFEELFSNDSPHFLIKNIVKQIVQSKVSFLISGATGTGKTTLLSTLTNLFTESERVLFIEEINEITSSHSNSVYLQSRSKNIENKGEVTLSDLVHAAMRMRPDRIILGECRGKEISDILNAFNTGHEGGICTIHANNVVDIPSRILALGKLANLDIETITYQSISAIKIALHLGREEKNNKICRWIKEIGIFSLENNKLICTPCIKITKEGKIMFLEKWQELKTIINYVDNNS